MNFDFIGKIAEKNPALARLIDLSITSAGAYILAAIVAQDPISWQALMIALIVPIESALSKRQRDLLKNE